MLNVPAMERIVMIAIGFFVLMLVLTRGIDRLLLWIDDRDWILIPNREVVKNSSRLANFFLEMQAYVEPAKQQIVEKKEADKLKREQDEQGDGPAPTPTTAQPPDV